MIVFTVMYPNGPGKHFDMDYYTTKHIGLVEEKAGDVVKGVSIERGLSGARRARRPRTRSCAACSSTASTTWRSWASTAPPSTRTCRTSPTSSRSSTSGKWSSSRERVAQWGGRTRRVV